jgi:hypothetical protein
MTAVIFLILLATIFAIVGAKMAENRNRDRLGWAVLCACFGLIAVLILAIAGRAERPGG